MVGTHGHRPSATEPIMPKPDDEPMARSAAETYLQWADEAKSKGEELRAESRRRDALKAETRRDVYIEAAALALKHPPSVVVSHLLRRAGPKRLFEAEADTIGNADREAWLDCVRWLNPDHPEVQKDDQTRNSDRG